MPIFLTLTGHSFLQYRLPIFLCLIVFTFTTHAAMSSPSHAAILPDSTSTSHLSSAPLPPPLPTPPPLSGRCRICPANNTLGLTCYKNTLCIPTTFLCTLPSPSSNASTCPDLPGAETSLNSESVQCSQQDQLCSNSLFLPLPSPGVGLMRRDTSSSSCLKGSFYSLYSSSFSDNNRKYIQSCIVPSTLTAVIPSSLSCQEWEYRVGNSCLLRLCGGPTSQQLSCVPPYVCRRPPANSTSTGIAASIPDSYGVCNSTHPLSDNNGDDGSNNNGFSHSSSSSERAKKEELLINLLIAFCVLAALIAFILISWHIRKRYLQKQGKYLSWSRQDKTHFLQACICRRSWSQLWKERDERLKNLQGKQEKWSSNTPPSRPQQQDRENSVMGSNYDSTLVRQQVLGSLTSIPSPTLPTIAPTAVTATTTTSTSMAASSTVSSVAHPNPSFFSHPRNALTTETTSHPDHGDETPLRPQSSTNHESIENSPRVPNQSHQPFSLRHRSVLDIFARRWQNPQQQGHDYRRHDGQHNNRHRDELEPLPVYRQEPDLPAYRVHSPEPALESIV